MKEKERKTEGDQAQNSIRKQRLVAALQREREGLELMSVRIQWKLSLSMRTLLN